jgi:LysR substrate binding domain
MPAVCSRGVEPRRFARRLYTPYGRLDGPHGSESVKVTEPRGANHSDAVRDWALPGRGIVFLSSWDVAPEFKQGRLQRVLPAYCQVADVWAATATRPADAAQLKICVEFLREQLTRGKNERAGPLTAPRHTSAVLDSARTAGRDPLQPGHHAQHRRLAAERATELQVRDVPRHPMQNLGGPVGLLDVSGFRQHPSKSLPDLKNVS